MKKLLLILLSLVLIFCVGVYILIPEKVKITSVVVVNTTDVGTERFLIDETKWANWWNYRDLSTESKNPQHGKQFVSGDYDFTLVRKYYKSGDVLIRKNSQQLDSKLIMIPLAVDSTGIEWRCSMDMGSDPYTRLTRYLEAKQVKKNMDAVLGNLKLFLSKNENIYGIHIEKDHLKDTLYVSSKATLSKHPSIKEVYEQIHRIENYITATGAKPSGSPIYNITQMDNGHFQLMTAVPVEKGVKETDAYSLKHMVRGYFMITEVVGGDSTINTASKSLQQYFREFHKTSMAMNFTMLITDRMLQPDSTKWITRLYQPVY